jgi:hypothetical protein
VTDQAGVLRREALVVEPELGEPADLEVLDQHIRARGELAHGAAAVLALEIELDRALATVRRMVIGGTEVAAVGALNERRSPSPRVVAGALALDLDHVGAEVGQHLSGPRPGEDAGELEHAKTGERTRHENHLPDMRQRCRDVGFTVCLACRSEFVHALRCLPGIRSRLPATK